VKSSEESQKVAKLLKLFAQDVAKVSYIISDFLKIFYYQY